MCKLMRHSESSYRRRTVERLNKIEKGLWHRLDRVPKLPPEQGQAVLRDFLEQACECQHIGNIQIGRYGIWSIPRDWVLKHIEELAEPLLEREDDYEYHRLFEVYEGLDKTLARKLALHALESSDPDIQEAGSDFLESLASDDDEVADYLDQYRSARRYRSETYWYIPLLWALSSVLVALLPVRSVLLLPIWFFLSMVGLLVWQIRKGFALGKSWEIWLYRDDNPKKYWTVILVELVVAVVGSVFIALVP